MSGSCFAGVPQLKDDTKPLHRLVLTRLAATLVGSTSQSTSAEKKKGSAIAC